MIVRGFQMYLVKLNEVFEKNIKAKSSKEALQKALTLEGFTAKIAEAYEIPTGHALVINLETKREKKYDLVNIMWVN